MWPGQSVAEQQDLSLHSVGRIMISICVILWDIFRLFPLILLALQGNRLTHTVGPGASAVGA